MLVFTMKQLKLSDLIVRDLDHLASLETADNGKPIADAKEDVQFSADVIRYYAGWADKVRRQTAKYENSNSNNVLRRL